MNIWSRLGISVAIAATFCIIMTEVFQNKSYYGTYKWYICATFLVAGVVLGIVGKFLNARRRKQVSEESSQSEATPEETVESQAPFILFNLAYWGVMLLVFGITIIFIVVIWTISFGFLLF